MKKELVFDTTTNELKLLEFQVGNEYYGINIAKVSEIIRYNEITPMPSAPPEVEGVFMHREKLVTVVSLNHVLSKPPMENPEDGLFIVCDFEQLSVAFHVEQVNGIRTFNWSKIDKPPAIKGNSEDNIATGVAKFESKIIMILDFEKIICDLNTGHEFEISEVHEIERFEEIDYSRGIVIAEDSVFLSKVLVDALRKAGYTNVSAFYNGLDAWDYIYNLKGTPDLKKKLAAVITDIEMPRMDGHTLTKFIKTDKELRTTPVFLFSSLIHENMRMRGDSAGADAQFSRSQLVELLNELADSLKGK